MLECFIIIIELNVLCITGNVEHNIKIKWFLPVLQLFREVRIMKMLDHPNIGKFRHTTLITSVFCFN
jgi:hypothetical protein